jgi:tetratricopeptide (TPR) repeat protein
MTLISKEIQDTFSLINNKKFNFAESQAWILLNKEPNNAKIYELIGEIYAKQNLPKKSIWAFLAAYDCGKDDLQVLFKIAENMFSLHYDDLAKECLKKIIELEPLHLPAYVTLGLIHQKNNNIEEAVICFEDVMNIDPKFVGGYLHLALLYKKNKEFDKAIKVYQQAIINNPNNHIILSNLGNLFYLQKKYDDAILCQEKAIKIDPSSSLVHFNYANTLMQAEKFQKAEDMYKKTLNLDPNFTRAHINLGSMLLANKNFAKGYEHYRHRIQQDQYTQYLLKQKKPIWQGEDLAGKRILVCADGGYGNIIQFARYLHLFQQYNCEVIFACPIEIQHLFENSEGVYEMISPEEKYENYDYWIALGDLPFLLTRDLLEECPVPVNIKINENKLQEWEMLLGVDEKIKIGLCWQGDPNNPRDYFNSQDLSMFKDLIDIEHTSFISLQKGYARSQIERLNLENKIVDYDPLMDQGNHKFLDTVAIIKYLDLVITTDTSIAHLAGSLGTQTYLLLPYVSDWRWFKDTDETVWYDNVRILRQNKNGLWPEVFKKLKLETENVVKNIFEIRKTA